MYYIYIYTYSRVPKLIQSSQEAKPCHRGLVSRTPYACKVTKQKTAKNPLSNGFKKDRWRCLHWIIVSGIHTFRVSEIPWNPISWLKSMKSLAVTCSLTDDVKQNHISEPCGLLNYRLNTSNITSWQSSRWPCTWVSYGQTGQFLCPPAISASCFHM